MFAVNQERARLVQDRKYEWKIAIENVQGDRFSTKPIGIRAILVELQDKYQAVSDIVEFDHFDLKKIRRWCRKHWLDTRMIDEAQFRVAWKSAYNDFNMEQ